MITGARPFEGENVSQLITNILFASIPTLQDKYPADLVKLMDRMLQREPKMRIISIREIAIELEKIRDSIKSV